MKNKLSLWVLIISLLFSLVIPASYLGLLDSYYKYELFEVIFNQSIFFSCIFFFSLITYFAPDRVFQSWWRFARIAIPTAFVLSLIINLEIFRSPGEQWGALIDIPALIVIYSTFALGSAWQIWKGWRSDSN